MVNVGLVGYGSIGREHVRCLSQIRTASLVAVMDVERARLDQLSSVSPAPHTYTEFEAFLGHEGMDAVLVCTPTYTHREIVVAACERHKHVFCEKPIALSLGDADAMMSAAESNGVKLAIGFTRRFDNTWNCFRSLIERDAIGRPVVWRSIVSSCWNPVDWFFDADKGAGPFVEDGVHFLDFASLLFGQPVLASSITSRFRSTSAIDTGTGWVEFESGDLLVLSWTWGLPSGCKGVESLDAVGPRGSITFPSSVPVSELPSSFDRTKNRAFLLQTPGDTERIVPCSRNDMYLDQMTDFIASIDGDRQPRAGGKEGWRALAACLAFLNAGEKGCPEEVPILE